ncbi:MAG: hypothetical protein WCF85_12635 [Rhodospirillaceae bacterium]
MTSQENGFTPSERLVAGFCHRSFLRLWTHPNPKGKKGKELCDCLIVCDRHVVIISVKDCAYRNTGDTTGWERWKKKAIEASMSQIAGAERWLATSDHVERADGRIVRLPPHDARLYHRVAVALGANGEVPVEWGDKGKGFIHLCDERSLEAIFASLDTITDFVKFLSDTEALFAGNTQIIFSGGGIENLLALYLEWGEEYSLSGSTDGALPDLMVLENDLWTGLSSSKDFKQRQKDLEVSYVWDRLIEHFTDDLLTDGMFDFQSKEVTQNQLALIEMVKQPRHNRTQLAKAFLDYLSNSKSAARVAVGYGGTAFVFMARSSADRDFKVKELLLRCQIVRACCPGVTKVVGIGTDRPGSSAIGHSSDLIYLDYPEFTDEQRAVTLKMQEDLGYFKGVTWGKG